jgi:osmotically-inducible protein OsmY
MRTALSTVVASSILSVLLVAESPAQDGTAEQIGRRIDQGLQQLGEEVQEAWTRVRKQVDQLGVQGRVYGRLHWDKALANAEIDVDVEQQNAVVLTGRVADEEAHKTALRLARDTVGVRQVIDHLRLARFPAPPSPDTPAAGNASPD